MRRCGTRRGFSSQMRGGGLPRSATRVLDRYAAEPSAQSGPRISAGRRFLWLARAFLSGDSRRRARLWFAALIVFSIAVGGVQVLISFAARDFVTALTNRDAGAFYRNLWWYLGTFVIAIPVGAFYKFTADRLSLAWREWMTNHLLRRYFYNRVYYRLRGSRDGRQPRPAHRRGRQALHDEHPRLPADRASTR